MAVSRNYTGEKCLLARERKYLDAYSSYLQKQEFQRLLDNDLVDQNEGEPLE
ncbi:hypothetical protein [Cylindrospermum sp. FACHB-282]|uniref:hypothetical protein n=1 Tax=Cylindrospermum sp. FACHB-282 TaxID=2692794 RepID=UPI001686C685|nr:hypothetical protein [Cylindrospermum sp. FACHB-282]MBD2387004.1 hypothetical protein [Cylindrospermum sp. FACHB-282]